MSKPPRIANYPDFWLYYLREHSKPATRLWHMLGTGLACAFVATAALRADYRFLVFALAAGYGPAWLAHYLVEKNRPASFRYPLWSLYSDFRMAGLALAGRLGRELSRAGIEGLPTGNSGT